MSQVTQPTLSARSQLRAHWIAALSALLALLATAAVVLVLAIDGGSSGPGGSVAERQQPALRLDGGPDESAVAAAIGSRLATSVRPDESTIAASVGSRPSTGPDESAVASRPSAGPGERAAAASIRGAVPPQYLSDPAATPQSSSGR
jgi:hypothetical protein